MRDPPGVIGWSSSGGSTSSPTRPQGSSILTQLSYLTLPALALVIVYFGYIARMTRAGVIARARRRLHPNRDDEGPLDERR